MHKSTTSLYKGEPASLAGYVAQFDIFVQLAYNQLIIEQLEWIKIADPNAEKLDDIQFSVFTEIHAFQVKWTVNEASATFSSFIKIFPEIARSWRAVKNAKSSKGKKVFAYLLTNKHLSDSDVIKIGRKKLGTSQLFFTEIFPNLSSGSKIKKQWKFVFTYLQKKSGLTEKDFKLFIKAFSFVTKYPSRDFKIEHSSFFQRDRDLENFRNFLFERVAEKERRVQISASEIIKSLNWEERFKTTFNHELSVDNKRYQPITSTLNLLSTQIDSHKNGYIFLIGGPGTGKSTLLTQWAKKRKENIIKYYAFDFVNVGIREEERGEAKFMLFDLVYQLDRKVRIEESVIHYKDIIYLRNIFKRQLDKLGIEYAKTGQKTILIIDGLDHVPREYKSVTKSLIRELPLPNLLPDGVYILLGSQSYDLEDLAFEIKKEFEEGKRTVKIDPLNKSEVLKYINSSGINPPLTKNQLLEVFEITQGHPLYLSYFVEKLRDNLDRENIINSFDKIEGNIDNYYNKLWSPIHTDTGLIKLCGLVSRIRGSINPNFIAEWNFENSVLANFRDKAKSLFNTSPSGWTFFHNSFRQFLLYETALNPLESVYDPSLSIKYHALLAALYNVSSVEPKWKRYLHLYSSEQFDQFVTEATPENLTSQLIEFRPAEDIEQDIKLGIEIARVRKDGKLLVRYALSMSEIQQRLFNINLASFTEELLALGKYSTAKDYLRNEYSLRAGNITALKAAELFYEAGDRVEASLLFNLVTPDFLIDKSIQLSDLYRRELDYDELEDWVNVAHLFLEIKDLISRIRNAKYVTKLPRESHSENNEQLRMRLLSKLGFSLIYWNKWKDLNTVLKCFDSKEKLHLNRIFPVLEYAIEHGLATNDSLRANRYLNILLKLIDKSNTNDNGKISLAYLIYKVTGDIKSSYSLIRNVDQQIVDKVYYDESFVPFLQCIKHNIILYLSGHGLPINEVIPEAKAGTEEVLLMDFHRMLCLLSQIYSECLTSKVYPNRIANRILPLVHFYYQNFNENGHNRYSITITRLKDKYFDTLFSLICPLNIEYVSALGNYFLSEFRNNRQYWSSQAQRNILKLLLTYNYNPDLLIPQLAEVEAYMLEEKDIDGRITECMEQSQLWLKFKANERAIKWLHQAIKQSFGVGFRKDYQFTTWIKLLGKALSKSPTRAEDLKWFLSHLHHIKKTTEGNAYWNAAEDLLDVAFEYNFQYGLEQLKWQLRKDLIDFEGGISSFIYYFIDRATTEKEYKNILEFYCEIFLPISVSSGAYPISKLLHKGHTLLNEAIFVNYIPKLIDKINIKSLEENRFSQLSAIKEFVESKNYSVETIYPGFQLPSSDKDTSRYVNMLLLKNDGTTIEAVKFTEEEVIKHSTDYERFIDLMHQENKINSSFHWEKVLDKVKPLLNAERLKEIAKLTVDGKKGSIIFSKLSELALYFNDPELALNYANNALDLSTESGWIKHYDGGTRLMALSALKNIDEDMGINKGFELFVNDLKNVSYVTSYIKEFDEILPLISKDNDLNNYWDEIYGYVKRLFANSMPESDLPTITNNKKLISDTYVDLLIYLSDNPVKSIKEQSRKHFALIIESGEQYAINQLREFLSDFETNSELISEVLMYLFVLRSNNLQLFISGIREMALYKNYSCRMVAHSILNYLGETLPEPKNKTLPEIYKLHLSKPRSLNVHKEIDPYFPNIDINNPEELIKPLNGLINVIARHSKLNENNLLYRVSEIMNEIDSSDKWTTEYEKALRNHLSEIGLKYSYVRPRVITARKAIMIMYAELKDCGIIEDTALNRVLLSHDYCVPFYNESLKPAFIQTLKETPYGSVEQNWVSNIADCKRLSVPISSYKNMSVIAEYSKVKSLDWGTATEVYQIQLSPLNKVDEPENIEDSIFDGPLNLPTEDYYQYDIDHMRCVLRRDHRFDQFTVKSKWLAINPSLAYFLDWVEKENSLFGWKNSHGELMAESIYWSNGNTEMRPPKINSESGEGWLVVISEKALAEIRSAIPQLFIHKTVTRSKFESSEILTKSFTKVESF